MIKELNFYIIKIEYLEYLRLFDKSICWPKKFSRERPYVGVLIAEHDDFYYFAPITSKNKKASEYFVRISDEKDQYLGGIRINNCIPIPKNRTDLFRKYNYDNLIKSRNLNDQKYGRLLQKQHKKLENINKSDELNKKFIKLIRNYKYRPWLREITSKIDLLKNKSVKFNINIQYNIYINTQNEPSIEQKTIHRKRKR